MLSIFRNGTRMTCENLNEMKGERGGALQLNVQWVTDYGDFPCLQWKFNSCDVIFTLSNASQLPSD